MATVNGNVISFRNGQPVLPSGPWQTPQQAAAQPGRGALLGGTLPGTAGGGGGSWTTVAAQRPATPTGQPGMGTPPAGGDPGPGMSPTGRAGLGAPSAGMARGLGPGVGGLSGSADPWTDGTIAAMSGPQAKAAFMDWDPLAPGIGRIQGGTLQDAARQAEERAAVLGARGGMAGGATAAAPGPGMGRLSTPLGATSGPAPHPAQWAGVPGSEIANRIASGGMARYSHPGGMEGGQPGAFPWLPQPAAGGGGCDPRFFAPIPGMSRLSPLRFNP